MTAARPALHLAFAASGSPSWPIFSWVLFTKRAAEWRAAQARFRELEATRQEPAPAGAGAERRRAAPGLAARPRPRRPLQDLPPRHRRPRVRGRAAAVPHASRHVARRRTRPIASAAPPATTGRARRPTTGTRRTSRSPRRARRCARWRRSRPTAARATARSTRPTRRASPKGGASSSSRAASAATTFPGFEGVTFSGPGARQHRATRCGPNGCRLAEGSEELSRGVEDGQLPPVRRRARGPAWLPALAAGSGAARQHRRRLEEGRRGRRPRAVRRAAVRELPCRQRPRRDHGPGADAASGTRCGATGSSAS